MTKAKALLLASMVMVTGCSFIPRYQRPEAPVPSAYPTAGITNAATATIPWNRFFTDARQQQLIALALTNNRDLRAAALRVDQSQAQYRISRSALFPREVASAGFDRTRAGGVTRDQWSANLGTTAYEVDLFGRVRSLNRQALEKYLATAEARRATQVALVAEVATADLDLRRATQQLALANETLRLVEESRTLNKAAFDVGASNELDVRSADAQIEFTRVSLLEARLQMAEARNRLEFLIGQALPAELASTPSPLDDELLARVPAGLPSELIQFRPDILQAEHTLRAANANIGAARAAFLPTLRLPPDQEDDFNIFNQKDVAATVDSVTSVIKLLLGSVSGISLVVGGIGIMNIMLVSVTERTREIGLRIAVGAQPAAIRLQFLLEAVALSLSGGLVGVVLGIAISQLLGRVSGFDVAISPESIALAFGVSFAIGAFFGFYPARRAAALDPIEALRYE